MFSTGPMAGISARAQSEKWTCKHVDIGYQLTGHRLNGCATQPVKLDPTHVFC
jgi:hypothetical protein